MDDSLKHRTRDSIVSSNPRISLKDESGNICPQKISYNCSFVDMRGGFLYMCSLYHHGKTPFNYLNIILMNMPLN